MVTLYNAISSDGYIARKDGSEDFIPDELWAEFVDICKQNDAIVFGKGAYDAIQTYDKKSLNMLDELKITKIVVSRNPDFYPKKGYAKANSLKDAFSLKTKTLFSSGPTLNTLAIKEKLIDRIILNVLPEKIGNGIKMFDGTIEPLLIPVSEEDKGDGRKLCTYRIR